MAEHKMSKSLLSILESRISGYHEGGKVFTYQNLLDSLLLIKEKNPELMRQSVQVVKSNPTPAPDCLLPVLGVSTCEDWGLDNTLNADDHKHHPNHLVLLTDYHPYGENGEIAYEHKEDGTFESIFPTSSKWSGD